MTRASTMTFPVEEAFAAWRRDPEYVEAYDALEGEFSLARAGIEARAHDAADWNPEITAWRSRPPGSDTPASDRGWLIPRSGIQAIRACNFCRICLPVLCGGLLCAVVERLVKTQIVVAGYWFG